MTGAEDQREGLRASLSIPAAQLRILSLRFDAGDLARLGHRHLVYGLLVTWAVGIGRYWDHPDPYLLQSLGLGSLAVVGSFGLVLYLLLWPLRPSGWSLVHLYTFLSLTSLPAILYAIPVERFLSLDAARAANLWFLATVALWRVAMLGRYLAQRTDLSGVILLASLLLPLSLVIVALTLLNLEKAVFDVMAGLREDRGTPGDEAYGVLFFLSTLCFFASPALLLSYAIAVWKRWGSASEAA